MTEIQKATLIRFARTYIPQLPATITSIVAILNGYPTPVWLIPGLVALGATITALDKFCRDMGWY